MPTENKPKYKPECHKSYFHQTQKKGIEQKKYEK